MLKALNGQREVASEVFIYFLFSLFPRYGNSLELRLANSSSDVLECFQFTSVSILYTKLTLMLRVVAMYNQDTNNLSAIFFTTNTLQFEWPFGPWEGPLISSLMCYVNIYFHFQFLFPLELVLKRMQLGIQSFPYFPLVYYRL